MDPPTAPSKFCLNCRYPLDGLPANRCPECGREFDPMNRASYLRTVADQRWYPAVLCVALALMVIAAPLVLVAIPLTLVLVLTGYGLGIGVFINSALDLIEQRGLPGRRTATKEALFGSAILLALATLAIAAF